MPIESTPQSPPNIYETWRAIADQIIESWLTPKNLQSKNKITAQGFEITESIDGGLDKNVEVSLVRITGHSEYPQHLHKNSDAFFIIVSGEGIFLSGDKKLPIAKGEKIDIPRGTPHGFELPENGILEFVSFQSPPIIDEQTGEQDFQLFNRI